MGDVQVQVQNEEQIITIKASIADADDTKTAVQSDGTSIYWTPGDAINLFYGTASAGKFITSITEPALTTEFSGTLSVATGTSTESGVTTQSFWGVYPYNVSNTCTGDGVTLTIPSTQSGVAGSFADKLNPSVATSPGLSLAFYNVGSWFIFSVTQDDIVSVTLRGHNNEDLAGRVKVTMDPVSNKPVTQVLEGQKSITMTPAGGTFEVGESYYMVVIPGRMNSGLELTLTKSNGKQATWSINSDVTFTRSMYLRKLNADNGLTFEYREPLTITSIGSTTITLQKYGTPYDINLDYRIGNNEWASYSIGTAIELSNGESLQFRAGSEGNYNLSKTDFSYWYFEIGGTGTAEASGNIMSLLDRDLSRNDMPGHGFTKLFYGCSKLVRANNLRLPATTLAQGCYEYMFKGCTGLTSAPGLPATILAESCYESMFEGCINLTSAPELPATTLNTYCYRSMFGGCTGLNSSPELPATSMKQSCYEYMFIGCTGLTSAPELPATSLANYCYEYMFSGCTGLISAPELPATTLRQGCYLCMFEDCTGLTSAPELPATTLAKLCYSAMFRGCTGLSSAPELPATTLEDADACYNLMFSGCTGLSSAPELPATTLAESCYKGMFRGCIALTTAPELPALYLEDYSYKEMFYGCSNLNYIKMLATTLFEDDLYNWVNGVSATGTFVKNPSATWNVTGSSGIPSGWTVTVPTPEAVDLGLSVNWASFNLGALTPEEPGDYYSWGEVAPKAEYSWSTYAYGISSNGPFSEYVTLDTYGIVDNKTTLDLEDDAANVQLGGNWRMPTIDEWKELRANCTRTSETLHGINVIKLTSTKAGYTDKYIYLSLGNYRDQNPQSGVGSIGDYWSSSLEPTRPSDGCCIGFFYSGSTPQAGNDYRFRGRTIRAVMPK